MVHLSLMPQSFHQLTEINGRSSLNLARIFAGAGHDGSRGSAITASLQVLSTVLMMVPGHH